MKEELSRIQLTLGEEKLLKLINSHVAVFGIGGVGSYVVEALVRSGVGAIDIVDDDVVVLSNINRQLYALHSTVGRAKVDVAEERIHDINPDCRVTKHKLFFTPETSSQIDFSDFDYVIDCIDTVSGKIALVEKAKENNVPVICSMGAGNKLHPELFEIADISETSVCPLARVMRRELLKRNLTDVKVVYSKEKVTAPKYEEVPSVDSSSAKKAPGSNAFVPSVAGLLIASQVVRDLCGV